MEKLGTKDRYICSLTNVDAVEAQGMGVVEIVDAALGGKSGFDIEAAKDIDDLVCDPTSRVGEDGEEAAGRTEFLGEVLDRGCDLPFRFLGADTIKTRMVLGVGANSKTICGEFTEVFPGENSILGWGDFESCGELAYFLNGIGVGESDEEIAEAFIGGGALFDRGEGEVTDRGGKGFFLSANENVVEGIPPEGAFGMAGKGGRDK